MSVAFSLVPFLEMNVALRSGLLRPGRSGRFGSVESGVSSKAVGVDRDGSQSFAASSSFYPQLKSKI